MIFIKFFQNPMIFPGFPGVLSFFLVFQVFQVKWEPCTIHYLGPVHNHILLRLIPSLMARGVTFVGAFAFLPLLMSQRATW